MLIAYEDGRKICAHCGKVIEYVDDLDEGISAILVPGIPGFDLRNCEKQILLCKECASEKGDEVKAVQWYPYLSHSRKEKLKRTYRIIREQIEKKRTHLRNTDRKDTMIYRHMGDIKAAIYHAQVI